MAPFGETARGLKPDSAWITAFTKAGLSAFLEAWSAIASSYRVALAIAFVVLYPSALP